MRTINTKADLLKEINFATQCGDGFRESVEIALGRKFKWPLRRAQRIRFDRWDFGSVLLGGVFSHPEFLECEFFSSQMDGINAKNTLFNGCRFSDCNLGQRKYSHFANCKFRDCEIDCCRVFSSTFSGCEFSRCKISGDIRKVMFKSGNLSQLKFNGSFRAVNFFQSEVNDIDFSNVAMIDTTIDVHVNGMIKFPANIDCFVVPPSAFRHALSKSASKISIAAMVELEKIATLREESPKPYSVVYPGFLDSTTHEDDVMIREALFESRIAEISP
jgi:hypothetical protein